MYNYFSIIATIVFIVLIIIRILKKNSISEVNIRFKNSKIVYFLILIILLIFVFTRIYKLATLPRGMHCDEVGVFYDTYTLAKFGVDRYLKSYPVYFINFGGGMPALYNYILLAIVKVFNVFDFGLFIGRLPAVINSFILLFSSYQITLITTKKQVYAIFTALLITISPYFIMSSRWALDCNYLLGFTTLSCYLMLLAVEKKKNYLFMITGLSFGFTLYSYALAYILVPLFLFLSVIYLYIKK